MSKMLVTVLLVVLMAAGWGSALLGTDTEQKEEYLIHKNTAEDYMQRGLYQKAAQEYEAAIAIENYAEDWTAMLDAYEKRYRESIKILDDYIEAAENAVADYPDRADYVLLLADLYIRDGNYVNAYRCLNKAIENGLEDENVISKRTEVKYAYDTMWNSFVEVMPCVNGYYRVSNGKFWSCIEEDGSDKQSGNFLFLGPVGNDGVYVVCDDKKSWLTNMDDVIQGYLSFIPADAGVYSEGLIAISDNGRYAYYNLVGDKQFGDYNYAGTFQDGIAPVKEGQTWYLIDSNGKYVTEEGFEDVILNPDGTCFTNELIAAKKEGTYGFFDNKGERKGNLVCSGLDVISEDGLTAYTKDGKIWGFVNTDGEEVIAPAYMQARSFAHGLAAVSNGEKWGFINMDGELVIDYTFFDVGYFSSEGFCMVKNKEDCWQMISFYVE